MLAFPPGLFQWNGGTLQGIITNTGTVTISGTNVSTLTGSNTTFFNQGTVQQTGSGSFLMGTFGGNVYFNNEPGAVYQFATDNVIGNDSPGNSSPVFSNQGLVWKSGGTNYSAIGIAFNNQGGEVKVDSGTLYLNGGGTSSNAVFNVAAGAVLDLTGGSAPTWSGELTGSGAGQVWLDQRNPLCQSVFSAGFPARPFPVEWGHFARNHHEHWNRHDLRHQCQHADRG